MRSRESPSTDEQILACIRTLSDLTGGSTVRSDMAMSALQSVMGTGFVEFVRDDDGTLWPFVRGTKFWRGPLRKQDGLIQEAHFDPVAEKITWVKPWDDDGLGHT